MAYRLGDEADAFNKQSTLVVMGPRFRGDDDLCFRRDDEKSREFRLRRLAHQPRALGIGPEQQQAQ